MKWKNTEADCFLFDYSYYNYYKIQNRAGDPFHIPSWWCEVMQRGYVYPKLDLSVVEANNKVTTINSESTLFFDIGSGFPRFKLGLTNNKRCIKMAKADYVVVSGKTDFKITNEEYIVLEDIDSNSCMYFISDHDWKTYFNNSLVSFVISLKGLHDFTQDVKILYRGKLQSFDKNSLYLAKYATGEYTLPYITDKDLDKICCNMCPDPTYDEFMSIIDMLNSDDASVVQLGVKMLAGYNIEKYKLSFRLILCTRRNWLAWSKNLVACKQLTETLDIGTYDVYDSFSSGSYRCERSGESYTIEDIAIAKKLAIKLIREDLQNYFDTYYKNRDFQWLPDEKTVELK